MRARGSRIQIIKKIDSLLRNGEALRAYDLATDALLQVDSKYKDALILKHRSILSLLRSGASEQARLEYQRLGLATITNNEDILALGGRLIKDAALETTGEKRRTLARKAAKKYAQACRQTSGYFSAINQATLSFIAGDIKKSRTLAKEILAKLSKKKNHQGEIGYYLAATQAEAQLLLGNQKEAEEAFTIAITLDPDNFAARATTLHQLTIILDEQDKDKDWLDLHRPPKVAHFAGHIFMHGKTDMALKDKTINRLHQQISDSLKSERIGFCYGALAAGSDILIAESLLANGGEFHLVLPVPEKAFIKASVAPYGKAWIKRFNACFTQATSIHYATDNLNYLDHPIISFSNQVAMGLSVLKAVALETEAVQILTWDGQKQKMEAGITETTNLWKKSGRTQIVLPFPIHPRSRTPQHPSSLNSGHQVSRRSLMAMLFVDVRGYSTLTEEQIPIFIDSVLARLAACCEKIESQPSFLNTWGDGLFLAFENITMAALMAVKLQKCFRSINLNKLKLPEHLALRIGGHYGPVYKGKDPYLKQENIFGTEITFAARIEPVTPPGSIYVSEHFASILASLHIDRFQCDYAGQTALKKKDKKIPLFSLRTKGKLNNS